MLKKDGMPNQTQAHLEDAKKDFVFKYLVAEIVGQRGDLAASSEIFYELAKSTQDVGLAERAAKVATYANVPALVAPSIALWSKLDPNSTEAQQAMAEMLIASDSLNAARPYLSKFFNQEETRAGGFLYLNNLLGRSKNKAAVLHLVESLAAPYPNLAEAHFAVAQAAFSAGNSNVALKSLESAEKIKPNWDMPALLKGQILFNQAPQSGINFYQSFLEKSPNSHEIRLNLAKLLVSQKQFEAAKKQYPILLKNAGNNPDITTVIGLLSFEAGDYLAAEEYFQQALKQNSKYIDQLYIYLAQVVEKQNKDNEAVQWYSKVGAGQHYFEAQIGLAALTAKTQSVDKAIEKLDELENLTTEQQISVIQMQASLLAKASRDQESFDLLDKAVNNLPNTPELAYDYALAADRVHQFVVMETALRKIMTATPDFAAAYNALGYSFADRNIRLDEAVKLIEKALALSPNDHYILDSLGWAHYRKGNLDKALKYLKQAYQASQDAEIAAHLGEVMWQKGQHQEAEKIWSDALSKAPANNLLISTLKKFKP